jgi:diacylglycerol kinase (ATP)
VTLLHNRGSGLAATSTKALKKALQDAGFDVTDRSAKRGWKKSLELSADLVAVAGGDGTVAKIGQRLAGRNVPMAILPLGSANNIARSVGLAHDPIQLALAWRAAKPVPFDVGSIRAGRWRGAFVECFGGGIIGALIERGHEATAPDKLLGAERDRGLLLLRDIVRAAPQAAWQITIDGRDVSGEYLAVEVMNISTCGPVVPLAPEADPGDGAVDLVLVTENDRDPLLDYIDGRLQGDAKAPQLAVHRGREIKLRSAPGVIMHVDDELVEPAQRPRTYQITVKPNVLQVLPNAA